MGLFDWLFPASGQKSLFPKLTTTMTDKKKVVNNRVKSRTSPVRSKPLDNLPTYGEDHQNSGNNSYRDLSMFNVMNEPATTHHHNHSHDSNHGSTGSSSWSDSSSSGSYDSGSSSSSCDSGGSCGGCD